MSKGGYWANVLVGGGTGALDSINGTGLNNLDTAWCRTIDTLYPFTLDATSGAAEDSPNVIAPDNNAGTKRWLLSGIRCNTLTANAIVGITLTVSGRILASDGTSGAPSLGFINSDRGFYLKMPSQEIGIALGAQRFTINAVGGGQIRSASGYGAILNTAPTATFPSVTPMIDDPDTGMGRAGTNMLSLIAGGKEMIRLDSSVGMTVTIDGQALFQDGTNAHPSMSFAGAPDTGWRRNSTYGIAYVSNGVPIFYISNAPSTGIQSLMRMKSGTGTGPSVEYQTAATATVPTIRPYELDVDTGIGTAGTDRLSMIAGGTEGVRVSLVGLTTSVDFVGATRYGTTVSHDGYVELEIGGVPYKFMLGS